MLASSRGSTNLTLLGKVKKWGFNVLVSIDQLGNTLTGGDPDETISSRLGKHYNNSFMARLVDLLFWRGHCTDSIEEDEGKDKILK